MGGLQVLPTGDCRNTCREDHAARFVNPLHCNPCVRRCLIRCLAPSPACLGLDRNWTGSMRGFLIETGRASSICCFTCRRARDVRCGRPKLREARRGQVVPVAVTVEKPRPSPPHRSRVPYRVYTHDDTGDLILTYFNARKDYLQKLLPEGETRYVSGTTEFYDGMLQMVHPDRGVDEKGFPVLLLGEPIYPLTEGLALGNVRRAMDGALGRLSHLPEWQDEAWVARERFPTFAAALRNLHRPAQPHDIAPENPAWTRLAYHELLAGQLELPLLRSHMRRQAGRGSASEGRLRARILKALPYALTHSQQRAVDDIITDLARPQRMLRLLQGDVGSGKTVVALAAAAAVIEAGRQAAFMAPTEILARQHLSTVAPLAEAAGIRVAILT